MSKSLLLSIVCGALALASCAATRQASVHLSPSRNTASASIANQPAGLPGYPQYADLAGTGAYTVKYDKRSLIIAGKPALFVSGAIHPPRGSPAMWGTWFRLAKENGLNMVQVYIFWNYHEPEEGVFNFDGRGNLTLFMQVCECDLLSLLSLLSLSKE